MACEDHGFSLDPKQVRVDFFREGGKWYATEAIVFNPQNYDEHPTTALLRALVPRLWMPVDNRMRFSGMWAVCLHPYVNHNFPIMVKVPEQP